MCWSPCHLLVSEGRDSQPPGTWRSPPAPTVVVIPGPGSFFCSQVATVYKSVSCFLWREGMPSDEQRAWGISPSKATQRPNCGPWAIGRGMGESHGRQQCLLLPLVTAYVCLLPTLTQMGRWQCEGHKEATQILQPQGKPWSPGRVPMLLTFQCYLSLSLSTSCLRFSFHSVPRWREALQGGQGEDRWGPGHRLKISVIQTKGSSRAVKATWLSKPQKPQVTFTQSVRELAQITRNLGNRTRTWSRAINQLLRSGRNKNTSSSSVIPV